MNTAPCLLLAPMRWEQLQQLCKHHWWLLECLHMHLQLSRRHLRCLLCQPVTCIKYNCKIHIWNVWKKIKENYLQIFYYLFINMKVRFYSYAMVFIWIFNRMRVVLVSNLPMISTDLARRKSWWTCFYDNPTKNCSFKELKFVITLDFRSDLLY